MKDINQIYKYLLKKRYLYLDNHNSKSIPRYRLRLTGEICTPEQARKAYDEVSSAMSTRLFDDVKTVEGIAPKQTRASRLEMNLRIDKYMSNFTERNTKIKWNKQRCRMPKVRLGDVMSVSTNNVQSKAIKDINAFVNAIDVNTDCFDVYGEVVVRFKSSTKYIHVTIHGDDEVLVDGRIYPSGVQRYQTNMLKGIKLW